MASTDRDRLLKLADSNLVLATYATERLRYRLSRSLVAAGRGERFPGTWTPGGPWEAAS